MIIMFQYTKLGNFIVSCKSMLHGGGSRRVAAVPVRLGTQGNAQRVIRAAAQQSQIH